jgi:hypothetical protein
VRAGSTLTYSLGGHYARFMASVGVDREVGMSGSVAFQAYVDGMKVYDSGTVTGGQAARNVVVNTTGKKVLRLVVTGAGNGNAFDDADWANARLITDGAAAVKPDASNTGPTNPAVLQPSGSITVTQDGAVIRSVDVTGTITIAADNVTLENFRVTADHDTSTYAIDVAAGHSGVVIRTGEVIGGSGAAVGGDAGGFALDRLNIHGSGADGVKANGASTIQNSWVHDINLNPGAHADCVQVAWGNGINILNNTFTNNGTSTIFMSTAAAGINGVKVDGNYLSGGSYDIYCSNGGNGNPTNVVISNNEFGRDARYGLLYTNYGGPTWTNNHWADTGAIANP